tara:strand:- start:56733 stop:57053 length:321 start_codon:yes stop_codon:yes gene_type:complete
MSFFGIVFCVILGLIFASFLIITPIRFYKGYVSNKKSYLKNKYREEIWKFFNKIPISELDSISREVAGTYFNDVSEIGNIQKIYNIAYRKYDPQYREDVIDDILEN